MVLGTLWHRGQAGNTDVGHCFVKLCWLQLRYQIQDVCSGYASHPPGLYCEQAHRFQNWFLFWHEDSLLASACTMSFFVHARSAKIVLIHCDQISESTCSCGEKAKKRSKRDFARSWCVKRNGLRYLRNLYGGNGIHGYNWLILVSCHEYYVNHSVPSAGFGSKSAMCFAPMQRDPFAAPVEHIPGLATAISWLLVQLVSRFCFQVGTGFRMSAGICPDSACQRVPDCVSARRIITISTLLIFFDPCQSFRWPSVTENLVPRIPRRSCDSILLHPSRDLCRLGQWGERSIVSFVALSKHPVSSCTVWHSVPDEKSLLRNFDVDLNLLCWVWAEDRWNHGFCIIYPCHCAHSPSQLLGLTSMTRRCVAFEQRGCSCALQPHGPTCDSKQSCLVSRTTVDSRPNRIQEFKLAARITWCAQWWSGLRWWPGLPSIGPCRHCRPWHWTSPEIPTAGDASRFCLRLDMRTDNRSWGRILDSESWWNVRKEESLMASANSASDMKMHSPATTETLEASPPKMAPGDIQLSKNWVKGLRISAMITGITGLGMLIRPLLRENRLVLAMAMGFHFQWRKTGRIHWIQTWLQ